MQDDLRHLCPVCTFLVRVEQAQIGHEMLFVIDRDVGAGRGFIIDIGVQFRLHTHRFRYLANNSVEVPRHELAAPQHARFVELLREHGVIVHTLGNLHDVMLQLYPRDIAFAVGDVLFLARSGNPTRRREQAALLPLLDRVSRVERLDDGMIEGGDVIVTDSDVLVGLGEATDRAGVAALRRGFERAGIARRIVPIEFSARGVVHFDTKFTIVGPRLGYVHSDALTPQSRRLLADRFDLIEASEDDARSLMINTFALAPDRIVIDMRAERLAAALRERGIAPILVDYAEVTRWPGGLRCSTLPLRREA